jgi:molecular chaperone GrpE
MANETDLPDFDDVEMESPMEEVHADPRDEEIIVLKEEAAALKDRLLRMAAEMENLRKRTEREKAEATLYAATNFARDLLSVADNLGRPCRLLRRARTPELKNLIRRR